MYIKNKLTIPFNTENSKKLYNTTQNYTKHKLQQIQQH